MDARSNNSSEQASATITLAVSQSPETNTLRLTANQVQSIQRRRVSWSTETVDNEGMGKKKSKCCCIYQKPRNWDESSEEDENEDDDCQNCRGHRKADYNSKREDKGEKHDHKHEHHHEHHHNHSDWNNENSTRN
jgi:protein phosphatase 1 regulatory subunit 11